MFVTPSGHRFTLGYHSLGEWAAIRMGDLLRFGCSDRYAEAVYRDYANAKRPGEDES
jgi:hypothetical protein